MGRLISKRFVSFGVSFQFTTLSILLGLGQCLYAVDCEHLISGNATATSDHDHYPAPPPEAAGDLKRVWLEGSALLRTQHAKTLFVGQGGNGAFIILPTEDSPLNQFAMRIHRQYGADTFFVPAMVADAEAEAAVTRVATPFRTEKLMLFLPLAALKLGVEIESLLSVQHEIDHLQTFLDEKSHVPYPLYGFVRAKLGTVPDDLNPGAAAYSTLLAFDEVKAFHLHFLRKANALVTRIRNGASSSEVKDDLMELKHLVQTGFLVSYRTQKMAEVIHHILQEKYPSSIQFSVRDNSVLVARGSEIRTDSGLIEFEVPIYKENLPDKMSASFGALREQVEWMRVTGLRAANQFADMAFHIEGYKKYLNEHPAELQNLADRLRGRILDWQLPWQPE